MKAHYIRAMELLHRACIVISGICLVVITLIIPWGVFTRYVLELRLVLAGAAGRPPDDLVLVPVRGVCYREYLHIGVAVIPMTLDGPARMAVGWLISRSA